MNWFWCQLSAANIHIKPIIPTAVWYKLGEIQLKIIKMKIICHMPALAAIWHLMPPEQPELFSGSRESDFYVCAGAGN